MRIVLDTNILISAFLTTTGPSQRVLSLTLRRHLLILSEYILQEFKEKMVGKLKNPTERVETLTEFFRKRAVILDASEAHSAKFSDKGDLPLLALIEISKAHYFVTGDKKLLELKKYGATLFVTPREAMEILENG